MCAIVVHKGLTAIYQTVFIVVSHTLDAYPLGPSVTNQPYALRRSISAREEIISYVTRYVEQLISDGLLASALDALRRFSLEAELELLQANRALPPARHHARLLATIDTTRSHTN